MPTCTNCGEDLNIKWKSCPFCSTEIVNTPEDDVVQKQNDKVKDEKINFQKRETEQQNSGQKTVVKTDNTTLWNVVIVIVSVAIILYPSGVLGLTIYDRATLNCEEAFPEDWEVEVLEECKQTRSNNTAYLFLTAFFAVLALLVNNKNEEDLMKPKTKKNSSEKSIPKEISEEQKKTRNLVIINLVLIPIFGMIIFSLIDPNPDEFVCDNGDSIESEFINDNIEDCGDGSDENLSGNEWIWEQNLSKTIPIFFIGMILIVFINYLGFKSASDRF